MTETITLKLTFEELKQIDKYVELNDETRPLFDKIKNAYPKPETLLDVYGDNYTPSVGSYDDAFEYGADYGEITFARTLLEQIGVEFEYPCMKET